MIGNERAVLSMNMFKSEQCRLGYSHSCFTVLDELYLDV